MKGLITLLTSYWMFFCRMKSFESNSSRMSNPSSSFIALIYTILEVKIIHLDGWTWHLVAKTMVANDMNFNIVSSDYEMIGYEKPIGNWIQTTNV
jgi:hypothetical protein